MGEGDVEIMLGTHQMLHAADNYGEIEFDPDGLPFRFQVHAGYEIGELNRTFALKLGRPAWKVDRLNRRPNGEINVNSFRELAGNSILEWTQLQTRTSGFQQVDLQDVSSAPSLSIEYQVDFSFTNNGSSAYYVLRIIKLEENKYRSVIQKKDSVASVPFAMSAKSPSVIYLRDVGVNETLYREKIMKIQRF